MKNLKFLCCSVFCMVSLLVLAGCENVFNQEKLSCDGDNSCSVKLDAEVPVVEVEEEPLVIVESENSEAEMEGTVEDEQPMMRKMLVDENATAEEIEKEMVETCENAGGTWTDGMCILEDGSQIAF